MTERDDRVERVARAAHAEWETGGSWQGIARAAIEAMLEPTREMLVAAYGPNPDEDLVKRRLEWEAMLNAALKDPPARSPRP